MPIIYLSPSTQENNMYVTGGSEEQWMNRLADAMVPYLDAVSYTHLLGERSVRIREVEGSNPFRSTMKQTCVLQVCFFHSSVSYKWLALRCPFPRTRFPRS